MFLLTIYFQYVQNNKTADNDWFRLESNKEGTKWFGKCWYIQDLLKYEFVVEFEVSSPRFNIDFNHSCLSSAFTTPKKSFDDLHIQKH